MYYLFKLIIIYYIFLFMVYVGNGIQTKKDFWLSLTPVAVIIYPIIWFITWYKQLD